MDSKTANKKLNDFKKYLRKKGISDKEISLMFSIDELQDKIFFELYDIDDRENSSSSKKGMDGIIDVNCVKLKDESYKEIVFESDSSLYTKTVNGRVVGIDFTYDNSLSIFLGDNYISFADTTIRNEYFNGESVAMREIYHYDTDGSKVLLDTREYLFEGKAYDHPVIGFDDETSIAFVSHKEFCDREEITLKGNAVSSLGITYNLDNLPDRKDYYPKEVKYIVDDEFITVYLDGTAYNSDIININPNDIQTDFEDRYWNMDDEL